MEGKKSVRFLGLSLVLAVATTVMAFAGGESEGASSATHGKYLAGRGTIIPPDSVHINGYVASMNYQYRLPVDEEVGLYLYSGNRQLSNQGQEELIQIAIQAKEMAFEDLPPMNLAFVIDKSGSMQSEDKIGWVKDAFDVFIDRVRDTDYVSLATFSSEAEVIFSSTRMTRENRLLFKQRVHEITPDGGTNLVAGLQVGYLEVMANFRSEYTNRVLFLTDGVGESGGILEMAESYKELGVNVSTIGVGANFDVNLMVDLARRGGGSSRFISDRAEMEETFGSELDRMIVPAVRDLTLRLQLPRGYEVLETWGYNNEILGREARFSQATVHHRDYETILVRVKVPPTNIVGSSEIARLTATYEDATGEIRNRGPIVIKADFVETVSPVVGYSNGMVLKSGTMLHFAQALITVGELYYSCQDEIGQINVLRDEMWKSKLAEQESREVEGDGESSNETDEDSGDSDQESQVDLQVLYDQLSSPEITALEESVRAKMRRTIDITVATKKELENARLRLDNSGFDDEIQILDRYIEILGAEVEASEESIAELKDNTEITPIFNDRTLTDHISLLFREIALNLNSDVSGNLAIAGFAGKSTDANPLIDVLNEMAVVEIASLNGFTIVERSKIDQVIEEQKLQLSGLVDTNAAVQVGRLLAADYILTGTVIEMPTSVIVFGRIIDVETSEVQSVAQVIVNKSDEVKRLLSASM